MKFFHGVLGVSLLGTALYAAPRSLEEIRNVAINFATEHSESTRNWSIAETMKMEALASPDSVTAPYRLIHLKPTGWVIVSDDDVARPVLGYNLDANNTGFMPENFKAWMRGISEQIQYAKEHYNDSPFKEEWNRLAMNPKKFFLQTHSNSEKLSARATGALKGPLLDTTWNQGTYYNTKCPEDADGPDGHVWAGCVAVAMTQIMTYYNWPPRGKGHHSYDSGGYGVLTADFAHTKYHWKKMPNTLHEYNEEVATIMYHAGVSVNMDYSPQGSGASMSDADAALKKYFRYQTNGQAFKNSMTLEEWENLLQKEINNRRPILYAGYQGRSSGHAFVCDGYDLRDPQNKKFHFNWGWSGYYDGYYAIGALNPGRYSFNDYNEVIYGIVPVGKLKAPANVQTKNITRKSVVLQWEDRTKNEKGFKIYDGNVVIKQVKPNTVQAKISDLIPGTKYKLRVAAYSNNQESIHVPVSFKTLGKRPKILPLRLNRTMRAKLTSKKHSYNRSNRYAEYFTFRLRHNSDVKIEINSNGFYAGIFLMDGKTRDGSVIYRTYTYSHNLNETINLEAGVYTVEVTSYYEKKTGDFTIKIED